MPLMKALIPSTILTLILSALVGPSGSTAYLKIETIMIAGQRFNWSWPFFMLTMGLFGILALQVAKESRS